MRKWAIAVGISALAFAKAATASSPCTPASAGLPCTTGVITYDGAGNIWTIGADAFTYDAFGRLVTANLQNAAGKGQTYTYDAAGNLLLVSYTQDGVTNGATIDNDAYPASNHLKHATYDDAGDAAAFSGMTFSYDASGMVTSTGSSSGHKLDIYTADDERIGTLDVAIPVSNTKISLRPYVATWRLRGVTPQVLRQLQENAPSTGSTTWTWSRDWTYRDTTLLAASLPLGANSETWRHYHVDPLGTPRLITDETGAKVSIHHYYPFGEEITSVVGQTEIMKFTGQERDFLGGTLTENKEYIDYMHARYEGPMLGRFLSEDVVPARLSVPQTWNRYSYAMNNPLLYVDPTGRDPQCFWVTERKDGKDEGRLVCTVDATGKADPVSPVRRAAGAAGGPGGGSGMAAGNPATDSPAPRESRKEQCIQNFLQENYGDFVAKTLAPDFSLISVVTDTRAFARSTALTAGTKGVLVAAPRAMGWVMKTTAGNLSAYPGMAAAASDAATSAAVWGGVATAAEWVIAPLAVGATSFATTADAYARWTCRNVS